MPIDCADAAKLIGADLFEKVQELSLAVYKMGVEQVAARGDLAGRHEIRVWHRRGG